MTICKFYVSSSIESRCPEGTDVEVKKRTRDGEREHSRRAGAGDLMGEIHDLLSRGSRGSHVSG